MILGAIVFSWAAACSVWLSGRRDPARDVGVTSVSLLCLLMFPLSVLLPKLAVLPETVAVGSRAGGYGWIAVLWAAGAVVCFLRMMVALFRLRRWRMASRLISVVCSRETGGRRVELRILPDLRSPVAAGVFRPVIYLPCGWEGRPEVVRRAVLLHECGHHRRWDPLWRMIAAATCAVHWFNPLVWWIARRMAAQCEYACDAAVLAGGFRAGEYAHMLCDFATDARMPSHALALASSTGLEARVRRLAAAPEPSVSRGSGAIALVFLLLAGTALAILGPAPTVASWKPSVPAAEIDLRWSANPFPGEGE
jgi:beta-lactamase regulating signal transducer with metallopeptidase domain